MSRSRRPGPRPRVAVALTSAVAAVAVGALLAPPAAAVTTPASPTIRPTAPACPTSRVPDGGFTDVAAGSPHAANIDCLVWWRVTQGRTATSFAPSQPVTREQMATFLLRVMQASNRSAALPASPGRQFRDVTGGVHAPAVDTMSVLGVMSARPDGTFGPTDPVTREQMATYLARTVGWVQQAGLPAGQDWFGDDTGLVGEANHNRVATAGITGGRTPGVYDPAGVVTRDQMASFLSRTLALLTSGGHARLPGTSTTPTGSTGSTGSTAPVAPTGNAVLDYARTFDGVPYLYGGNGPGSFDCSGFTVHVMRHFGVTLPRTSQQQRDALPRIPKDQKRPGDLIFVHDANGRVFHVSFYTGGTGTFGATHSGDTVRDSTLFGSWTVGRPR